jgi:hypothetical protein
MNALPPLLALQHADPATQVIDHHHQRPQPDGASAAPSQRCQRAIASPDGYHLVQHRCWFSLMAARQAAKDLVAVHTGELAALGKGSGQDSGAQRSHIARVPAAAQLRVKHEATSPKKMCAASASLRVE